MSVTVVAILLLTVGLPLAAAGQEERRPPAGLPASGPAEVAPESPPGADHEEPATLPEARDLLMAGDYDRAFEAYRALASDPSLAAEARVGMALSRMQVGKYDEAVEHLRVEDPPVADTARRHVVLAQLHRVKGRYEDALRETRAAIALEPGSAAARRLLAETLELLGREDEALEAYKWFDAQLVGRAELQPDAEWMTETGLGFLRYSVLTRTNVPRRTQHVLAEMWQVAYERLDRTYWPARIAAANLLREKFNNSEEDGSVSDYLSALRINGNLCEAHVGLGEVALERWDFEEVEQHAQRALEVNPHYAPALHLLAKKLIVERRYEQANEMCEEALAVNDRDLIALSISAAASACRYDDEGVPRARERVAAVNPRFALFHRAMGDALGGIRQYAAAEREYRQAIEYDANDANARTELGLMYMQWGREDKARTALDAAWALDPFNQRTKFTLELLDSLADFDQEETPHFLIRFDAKRDPGLGWYFADYMEDMYEEVVGDYEFEPAEKTIVELFPTQRAFGVRITGKPWIHTVGACTGRVIALASPRQAPGLMGTYNLGSVLKHEFTHTVTLAATNNRIPHWFTEALAVYQEGGVRSFFWCELLAEAARRDALFSLDEIDWAFMRPKRPNDRQMAYAQSEWMCEYIVQRFGYDVIIRMLEGLREGQRQPEVLKGVLGLEPDQFDRDFHVWAKTQAEAWGFDMTQPEDAEALREAAAALPAGDSKADEAARHAAAALYGRLARAEFDKEEYDRALEAARQAVDLDENEKNGLEIMARVLVMYAERGMMEQQRRAYYDEALPILERLWRVDPKCWTAPKYLAAIALQREESERALEPLKRLQSLCPRDPLSWRGLAGIYLERGDDALAFPQLLELVRIEENDAEVRAEIARIYKRRGRVREAQYWYRQALFIDPSSVDLHKALGDVSMQAGESASALREYKMLTRLEPEKAAHFERAAFVAHKLGDKVEAQRLAEEAVRLDPQSAARSLVP
jgi:tetratricopeptide (TPR) repeat protein